MRALLKVKKYYFVDKTDSRERKLPAISFFMYIRFCVLFLDCVRLIPNG